MPAKSKAQQRLFSMALAVRKGDLPRNKVWKSVLDIVDSDMTNKEIEDFTIMKESKLKSLYVFIKESLEQDKEFIKQSIDDLPEEDIQEIMEIITSNKPQLDKDQFYNYLFERGIEDLAKNILRIIKDNKQDYANLAKLINGDLNVPTSTDLIKNTNVYELFKDVFSKETLFDLSMEKTAKHATTRGAGEVLCRLIIKDANNGNGDFSCSMNGKIEFKVNGGRLTGQNIPSPKPLNTETEKILGISLKKVDPDMDKNGVFGSIDRVNKWFDLIEKYGKSNELLDILTQVISQTYTNTNSRDIKDLIKRNLSTLEKPSKERSKTLQRILGTIQLYEYSQGGREFDYLLVGASTKGQQDLCDYEIISSKETLGSLQKIFDLKNITYNAWPVLGGANRAFVEQILLKK